MQSFKDMYCHPNYIFREDEECNRHKYNTDELDHPVVFHQQDAFVLSTSDICGLRPNNVAFPSSLPLGATNNNHYVGGATAAATVAAATRRVVKEGEKRGGVGVLGNEYCGESGAMGDTSQHTDTSTDVDTDDRHQYLVAQNGAVVDSADQSKGKTEDQKTLRRLAQNREAARKSRLRKKAYVQQLENSRLKLAQLEQELEKARQQGFVVTGLGNEPGHSFGTNGVVAFDVNYGQWLDKHQRLINDTRSSLNSHASDDELQVLVETLMSNYDELFQIKGVAAKSDIFHLLSGMWKTPAERCFMWLGGFRSSELLKILVNQLEPLTEQQLMGLCNLQQSAQQAEDALSQGMEALQQSLVDTLSANCLGHANSGVVADYMGQMAIAMGKLSTLENFVHQADLLRQQTLQQMHRILTTRQAARALLSIHDYTTRLRALSSLWQARPKNFNVQI